MLAGWTRLRVEPKRSMNEASIVAFEFGFQETDHHFQSNLYVVRGGQLSSG